ncbi:TIGR04255 family protein [Streptomyces sp. NPDC090082]|uniref:TIGR04255 family protein n=1 Tax=unclassified Streptomyces TaxID=2593676 RepID=UPI003829C9F9
MSDRREYRNPPIVEALCTFNFAPGDPWNLTIPGRLYEQLKEAYPAPPEQRESIEANFDLGDPGKPSVTVGNKSPIVVFRNENKLLTVGADKLSCHSLAPYEGWESLRKRSLEALIAYSDVAKPVGVSSIQLRYVNRVEIPSGAVELPEYFAIVPTLPQMGFPGTITGFFDRTEIQFAESEHVRMAFTWASHGSDSDDISAFILDFDLRWTRQAQIDEAPNALEDLREKERAAFESLISDKLRGMFDATS